MQLALVDGKRTEPATGLKGVCPLCKQPVIAKCGNQRLHHWAHKSTAECDCTKEAETEWHRQWKEKFPEDWREIIHYDLKTNEKHIADVKTAGGMVIEFQYSHIDPKERQSREDFYKNMIWVVDGTRLKNDIVRFEKAIKAFQVFQVNKNLYTVESYEKVFPKDWLDSKVPVFIDFLGMNAPDGSWKNNVWCVFPQRIEGKIVFSWIERNIFVQCCKQNELLGILEKTFRCFFPRQQFVRIPPIHPSQLRYLENLLFGNQRLGSKRRPQQRRYRKGRGRL